MSYRKLLAEFLGAYILVTGASFAIFAANDPTGPEGSPVLVIALGFGLALLIGLYAFGEVSGGHFNPAVSLAAFLDRRLDAMGLVSYAVVQIAGAIAASATIAYAISTDFVATTATIPNEALGVGNMDVFLLEALFTAFFVAVILKVTTSEAFGSSALIAIPLTLVLIHLALVPLTGTSVNPARTLGPAIIGGEYTSIGVYLVATLVGAVIGWGAYKLVAAPEAS